jgi:hypothetical protein
MSKNRQSDQARLKVPETRRRALTSLPLPKLTEESSTLAMEIENDHQDHFSMARPPSAVEPSTPQSTSYQKALNSTFNSAYTPRFALSPASTIEGRAQFQNQTYLNNAKAKLAGAVATDFFAKHEVTEKPRARLLDWMIEVLKIYQQSEETLFRAFSLVDEYLTLTTEVVRPGDLHLLGSTCMYLASKQEEVRPIKLNALIVDICKGKFTVEDIFVKELEVLRTIGFRSQKPDLFELIRCGLNVLGIEEIAVFSFVENISVLIAKMSLFFGDIVTKFTVIEIAASTLIMALKLAESVHPTFCAGPHMQRIGVELQIEEQFLLSNIFLINKALVGFESTFPYVRNVEAFHKFAG